MLLASYTSFCDKLLLLTSDINFCKLQFLLANSKCCPVRIRSDGATNFIFSRIFTFSSAKYFTSVPYICPRQNIFLNLILAPTWCAPQITHIKTLVPAATEEFFASHWIGDGHVFMIFSATAYRKAFQLMSLLISVIFFQQHI
jgi:hypothetical protein